MALPPLKVRIGADTSALDKGLARAGRTIKGFSVAAVAGLVAVTGALTTMTVKGLAAVDANTKLARSMDGTVNGLRAVQLAGGDAGVALGEVNTATQQLTRELARAAAEGKGPAADALKVLRLRARDLQRLDVDERLALIADRAKQLGLSAGETSNLMRDLGVRSRNMALLLTQGGDAIRAAREEVREFGLELSETQTAAVERANDAVSRMTFIFESLSQQLAANVAPTLEIVAKRFTEFAKSDAAQKAIQRLADSFGQLAEIILSEDFLGTAASGLSRVADTASWLAEGMVTLSQNVELVTGAFAAASIAVAALGGPLTLVAGLLGGALVGIASLRKAGNDAADGLDAARKAQDALNTALGTFSDTASPNARAEMVALANESYKQATAALEAAEAEIAKAKAQQAALSSAVETAHTQGLKQRADERATKAANALAEAEAAVAAASDGRRRATHRVMTDDPVYTLPSMSLGGGDDDDDLPAIPSLPGGSAVQDQLKARLEALQTGLMTEREVIDAWYQEGLEVLREARENEIITERKYMEERERLEKEHQERLSKIKEMGEAARLQTVLSGGQEILQGMGSFNKKALRMAKVFGAAEALISTYRGAAKELEKGAFGFASAAAVIAKGLSFVGAIRGVSESSPSGAAAAGGGGAAQQARGPQIFIDVQPNARGDIPMETFRGAIDNINRALDRGGRIVAG